MTIEVKIPDIGVEEVEVTEILVKVGDSVNKEQSLITVEGDKASIEIPSPFEAIIKEIKVHVGDKVSTGCSIMIVEIESVDLHTKQILEIEKSEPEPTVSKTVKNQLQQDKNILYVHATPLIRRLAREFGINLFKIKGSGPKGRILREDIYSYLKEAVNLSETICAQNSILHDSTTKSNISSYTKIDFSKFGEINEIKLNNIQKFSGANLKRNWMTIPHVTQFDKIDITDLESFRKKQNVEAEKNKLNVKITPVSFIMKAVAVALEKMPHFNSSLSEDNERLILKKYINIGIAVDTKKGLIVPVIKNVNKKCIIELSRELMYVSRKARDGKLTIDEIHGGSFTISSIGNLGTVYFTPIINAPEVAILGVSKSNMEMSWNGTEFIPRLMLPVSLSFDHRVIDGADGVRFITIISSILSDIRRLVM